MEQVFHIAEKDGKHRTITLTGRNAWALSELIRAGKKGCAPIDTPGPRWSGYVCDLRHKHGVHIETITEPHKGPFPGTHARYVVRSVVFVVSENSEAA